MVIKYIIRLLKNKFNKLEKPNIRCDRKSATDHSSGIKFLGSGILFIQINNKLASYNLTI